MERAGKRDAGRVAAVESTPKAICVFLSSSEDIDERYRTLAMEVGTRIALQGLDVVSGGGRVGAMGDLVRSARSAGGRTIGVIPERLLEWEVADTDSTELIATHDMRERKAQMDARSDAFLVLPGGLGTLEELLEAWVGRSLGMHRKPVVILDPWHDWSNLRQLVEVMQMGRFVKPEAVCDLHWARNLDEAMQFISTGWGMGEGRGADIGEMKGRPAEWLEAD